MGEILLPGDEGFVSGMVQTGGGYEEVVENLNDKMNGASREKGDVPMDGEDDDDETSSDEDDEDEEADVVATRNKVRYYYESQKKLRAIKKARAATVALGKETRKRSARKCTMKSM